MWVQKYRPESLSAYRGASSEKKELKSWAEDWKQGDKPVLLHGQAGTGKTSMVEALAKDLDYELVETNASDARTKGKLKEELKEATRQASFYGGKKIILVDEVDGMGRSDRGGTSELSTIVDESRFPVVMTANDAYDSNIKTLRNKAKMIKLDSVHTNSIAAHLREILENEGIEYEDGAPKRIARQAGGQMRSAVNDLQAAAMGQKKLEIDDLKAISGRDSQQDIFQALKIVFKTTTASTAEDATDGLDEDPDTFLQWIRENVPREYERKEDVSEAYNWVSKADLFNGRIRRRQNWKLLKYLYKFATAGVALSKDEKYSGYTKYQYPSKISKMGSSMASRQKMDSVTSKMSEKLHISSRDAARTLPFISKLLKEYENIDEFFEFDEDEVEFVSKF